ncbi:hypothetical protein ANRL1_02434 [Anaerolineae bacterium]|nr:hypothetical protein ANRL1_02434 [Anaerolineae bacterium]
MSARYNDAYTPPFPAFSVILRDNSERFGPFLALIDTGADVTFVPLRLLERVSATESGMASIRSHFGEARLAQLYVVEFQIGGIGFPGIYVVGDRGDEIILGRNVLNKLVLFLDGPAQQTDVLDDAAVKRLRARQT